MSRDLRHSAEGSTWTKKNHKYIRKEGNRYIYPEDVQRQRGGGPIRRTKNKTARDILSEKGIRNVHYEDLPSYNRASNSLEPSTNRYRNTVTKDKDGNYRETSSYKSYDDSISTVKLPFDVNYRYRDEIKANKRKERQAENRSKAMNNQGLADYKKLSQQHANRQAAANGKVVNPIATWRGSDGRVIAREKTNEKNNAPTAADYKKYGQLRGGAANRSKAMSNQGSTDYKQLSKQQSRKKVLNSQGSSNRQQEAKDFKEYQDWEKADNKKVKASKEYYDALRSNTRNEKEFNDYLDEHNIARPDGSKPTASKSKKIETFDNSKNITTWDDVDKQTTKKSTNGQKGHFTLDEKTGQTVFVPDEDKSKKETKKKTNKALEKGKEAISKIKNTFRKKTDREKGVVSTREYRDYGKVNPGTLKEQMIRDGSANKEHYDYTTNRQALYNNDESRKKAEKKYRKGKSRYEPVSEYDNGYDPDTDSKRFRERYEEKKRRR